MEIRDQVGTFTDRVTALVQENQHLRVRTDNDDKTIALMKEQYDKLAASVDGLRDKHEREIHAMRTERDQAARSNREIEALLLQASEIVMQALRARVGDLQPPDRSVADHPALPRNVMPIGGGSV